MFSGGSKADPLGHPLQKQRKYLAFDAIMDAVTQTDKVVGDWMRFRFGNVAAVYYEILGEKTPRQLDLLDAWFPGLIIVTDESDGQAKREATYDESKCMIHAVKYHGRFYSGDSTRISQIIGRLVGTASGNKEKERKNAELIQEHIAECFVTDMTLTPRLKDNTIRLFNRLSAEQQAEMRDRLQLLIKELSDAREATGAEKRKEEAFPMNVFPSIHSM